MSEADLIQEAIYLNKEYQLYDISNNELIGGYESLKDLKADMFKLYCDYDEVKIKEDIDVWYMIKSMNSNSYIIWLRDALNYEFKKRT